MNCDLIANRDLRGDVGRCSSPPGMRRGIRRKAVHDDGGGGHVGNPSKVNMGSCWLVKVRNTSFERGWRKRAGKPVWGSIVKWKTQSRRVPVIRIFFVNRGLKNSDYAVESWFALGSMERENAVKHRRPRDSTMWRSVALIKKDTFDSQKSWCICLQGFTAWVICVNSTALDWCGRQITIFLWWGSSILTYTPKHKHRTCKHNAAKKCRFRNFGKKANRNT